MSEVLPEMKSLVLLIPIEFSLQIIEIWSLMMIMITRDSMIPTGTRR